MSRQIFHKTVAVDGVDIFYREAGDPGHPALLLLHGFPSSSYMFKSLMTALSDRYHLVAPDYPGFGFSAFPGKSSFAYSFKNISAYIGRFTEIIGLNAFTIYLHDYGCPIGLHLCINHPLKIEAVIVQNGNAYQEGIGPQWEDTLDYWAHPTEAKKKKVAAFLSKEGVEAQYTAGVAEQLLSRIGPEAWLLDWERMRRPGNIEIQFALNYDYRHNLDMFPVFQQYFRQYQPPALVIWSRHDPFFSVAEASCYQRDLPHAQVHILEGAHMLLETHFDEVLTLIQQFLLTEVI